MYLPCDECGRRPAGEGGGGLCDECDAAANLSDLADHAPDDDEDYFEDSFEGALDPEDAA